MHVIQSALSVSESGRLIRGMSHWAALSHGIRMLFTKGSGAEALLHASQVHFQHIDKGDGA